MPCKLGLFSTYLPLNPWSGPFSPDPVKRVRSVSELALTALRSLCNIHKALLLLIFFTSKLKAEPIILRVFFGAGEKLTCFASLLQEMFILYIDVFLGKKSLSKSQIVEKTVTNSSRQRHLSRPKDTPCRQILATFSLKTFTVCCRCGYSFRTQTRRLSSGP